MRLLHLLTIIIMLLVGVSFAALNASSVDLNLYITSIHVPVSLMIVFAMGIGMFLGFFLLFFKYLRLKSTNKKLNNRIEIAEKEIENLRAIPLQDKH